MDGLNLGNQLDETTQELIINMEKQLEEKDKEINDLKNQLAYLQGEILNKNRKIFGQSSEQVDSNQISIFDEAEKNSNIKVAEPTIEEIVYKREKPSETGKKDNLAGLERVVIEHKLDDIKAFCNKCNSPLEIIGHKSKEVLKYIPAKLYIEEHVTYSYACKPCKVELGDANIVTTKGHESILHKSMASNELVAHVINMKYQHALPLYRQETYFKMLGVNLSRQTLSNWIMSIAIELEPIYDLMKKELVKTKYIQADETTLKVIEDCGKDSKSKKYMWLYKTGPSIDPIILYDYQKTRSSSCPKEFLKDFSGYLQTDGYTGYNKVENIKRLYCLAHIRRKFYDIVVNLDDEALKKSRAIIGFNFCEQLYKIEKEVREEFVDKEDFFDKRYEVRLEKTAPLLKEFEEYVEREIRDALPKSALGQALEYTRKLLPGMNLILEDGALEIDNNASERSIKPFVIGRKNWLFSNTAKGARASALIYSIIETAKANNLVVEKYLVYLFNSLSAYGHKTLDDLKNILPWAETIPEELKITSSNKK
ncbi:IS66 family transposase [Clostridium sp.]|uniref:IS66 family transposase n=1 Tax=Clostridium sp. TaxID=1506 RepID=UPI0032176E0C